MYIVILRHGQRPKFWVSYPPVHCGTTSHGLTDLGVQQAKVILWFLAFVIVCYRQRFMLQLAEVALDRYLSGSDVPQSSLLFISSDFNELMRRPRSLRWIGLCMQICCYPTIPSHIHIPRSRMQLCDDDKVVVRGDCFNLVSLLFLSCSRFWQKALWCTTSEMGTVTR